MGLTKLARLTASDPVQLHVYLEAFGVDDTAYALYDMFQITDASDDYRLNIAGYSGTAGDALTETWVSYTYRFSTRDRDNDGKPNDHCAQIYFGAWWYGTCHKANLNGLYKPEGYSNYQEGIKWEPYKGHQETLKTTIMKIKRVI